jgi:glycyl-tRNA synthetase alpha subunit
MQLDPVSVELTYGLERIAIALQRVNSFRDIQWSPALTDGDLNLQGEQEFVFETQHLKLWSSP